MYNLIFASSVDKTLRKRAVKLFEKNYSQIRREVFLSTEPVEIFFHFSNNNILDGEANTLQRFIFFHLSDEFSDDEFILLLSHELLHLAHYEFFGNTNDNIKTIIDEGFAVFSEVAICKKMKLNAIPHPKTWKKKMSKVKMKELLKMAVSRDKIFDEKWQILHNNIDFEDDNFADRTIYQVGYWLVCEVLNRTGKTFEELFFEDIIFWNKQIEEVLGK